MESQCIKKDIRGYQFASMLAFYKSYNELILVHICIPAHTSHSPWSIVSFEIFFSLLTVKMILCY